MLPCSTQQTAYALRARVWQRPAAALPVQVEDIVDTGRTLQALIAHLQHQGAASVKIVTLLNKQARRVIDIQADYVGFEVRGRVLLKYVFISS